MMRKSVAVIAFVVALAEVSAYRFAYSRISDGNGDDMQAGSRIPETLEGQRCSTGSPPVLVAVVTSSWQIIDDEGAELLSSCNSQ